MVIDPILGYGLRPVTLADQTTLASYFQSLAEPLSDYTFSQLYTWRNSLRTFWTEIAGNLCVFVNGTGDLTLLLPPIGTGDGDRALRRAHEIMDDYNASHGVRDHSRVEYVSDELLPRFNSSGMNVQPMGHDYLYETQRMIDLLGGDLASKRQAKNRFMRQQEYRVEAYDPAFHFEACRALLNEWKDHQDTQHNADPTLNGIKRQKESLACELCLECAGALNMKGMVVTVRDPHGNGAASDWAVRAFTFGEYLGANQSSITIEKTDLECKGLAQFIFSEFCRTAWSDRPLVNVGDDWGLATLAWTKQSYRPVKLLNKYVMHMAAPVAVSFAGNDSQPSAATTPQTAPDRAPEPARWGTGGPPVIPRNSHAHPSEPASELALPPFGVPADAPHHEPSSHQASPTRIRSATIFDVPAAVELEQTCFSAYKLSRRQLRYLQKAPTAVFVVAEHENEIVGEGIALARRHHRRGRTSAPTGRIYSLAVKQSCRGQKIGGRLLSAMIEGLIARGVGRIYLEVEASNAGAIALYAAHGFRGIGQLPDYYGPAQHGLHMMYDAAAPAELFPLAHMR